VAREMSDYLNEHGTLITIGADNAEPDFPTIDIVVRLRDPRVSNPMTLEAADEIERLRAENERLRAEIEQYVPVELSRLHAQKRAMAEAEAENERLRQQASGPVDPRRGSVACTHCGGTGIDPA
jgi:hypothetical protein